MSPRVLWIALLVSLALNLSFVGAWGYSALVATDRGKLGVEALAAELNLSADQKDSLLALRQAARERWQDARGAGGGLRETVVAGLSAPSFERESVEAMMSERMTRRAGLVTETMGELHAYLQTLSTEQRAAFLERAKERGFLRTLFGRPRQDKRN